MWLGAPPRARFEWLYDLLSLIHLSLVLREDFFFSGAVLISLMITGNFFKALCDQLSVITCLVDKLDKSHFFLCGLGPHFSGFADTRMPLPQLPITPMH
ncbi:hypothetical protein ACS0TY_003418 [Phlomoides rotata]